MSALSWQLLAHRRMSASGHKLFTICDERKHSEFRSGDAQNECLISGNRFRQQTENITNTSKEETEQSPNLFRVFVWNKKCDLVELCCPG